MKCPRISLFLTTSVLGIAAFAASKKYGAILVCTKSNGIKHFNVANLSCVTVNGLNGRTALKCITSTNGHTAFTNANCEKALFTYTGN